MELDGFSMSRRRGRKGTQIVEYRPDGGGRGRALRVRCLGDDVVVELTRNGVFEDAAPGDRLRSPVSADGVRERMTRAMAVLHFDAFWLADPTAAVDVEMTRRGFEIGRLDTGELAWFRKERGITIALKRLGEEDDNGIEADERRLVSSYDDPVRLMMAGSMGKGLSARAFDFASMLSFLDGDGHWRHFDPFQDVELVGIYSKDVVTRN